jgi:hypothetical protein
VVKALPKDMAVTLRIDSTAAIGALSRGALSERKRVRAAGRAWLNFCRKDFLEKREKIKIEHVSSHKGTTSHEQKGNDTADKIANTYRRIGQATEAVPYFTESEERFLLKHKETVIQQDIRVFLKSLEKEGMLEIWKQRAPKQAQWFVKYPQQITNKLKKCGSGPSRQVKGKPGYTSSLGCVNGCLPIPEYIMPTIDSIAPSVSCASWTLKKI